jgi:hypothetical protein
VESITRESYTATVGLGIPFKLRLRQTEGLIASVITLMDLTFQRQIIPPSAVPR